MAADNLFLDLQNIEETYALPRNMFHGSDLFILKAKGNNMIDADIFDGDKVVVRRHPTANRGEIAVALVSDEVTQ